MKGIMIMAMTLLHVYDNGTSSVDQTMLVDPSKGGPVAVKANSSGLGSLLKALTSAAGALIDITDNAAQTIRSFMADGATAVALVVDTGSAWSDAAAKLQSWRDNAVEKAYLLATGDFYAAGMALENTPGFGSPMIRGQATNGYMSFTSDGVGPDWGGTGFTARAQTPGGPEHSIAVITVDDEVVAAAEPDMFLVYGLGSSAAPTLTIDGSGVISPDLPVSFVGAGLIKTITAANQSYWIEIIPTAAFSWDTSGNIALAGTAQTGRLLRFWHDNGTGLWYPSYT